MPVINICDNSVRFILKVYVIVYVKLCFAMRKHQMTSVTHFAQRLMISNCFTSADESSPY